MRNIIKSALVAILLFTAGATSYAQNISGRVVDSEGKPMPGASVYWADTNVGEAADIEGHFTLHRVKGYDHLVGSFLGYTNDTVRVDNGVSVIELRLTQGVEMESVVVERASGNFIRQEGLLKNETISFAGLCKMACCNLAESFENSASVTVGYSDAISGARQIKMLGLAGTYTQILDENRTIMRGIGAPYGLGYTPGMWLNSIQVSKGITSVTSGHEAITGQINLEHRKPTDEERLFLNLYFDNELKPEINLSTALPVTKDKRLSTVILAHASLDTKGYDHNGDGFYDLPMTQQFNVANRWLYQGKSGEQVRWGAKYVNDYRVSGMRDFRMSFDGHRFNNTVHTYDSVWRDQWRGENFYGSSILNESANAYFKFGRPVGAAVFDAEESSELRSNIAFIVDYDFFDESAYFGADKHYDGRQHMANANIMYSHYFTPRSSLIVGIAGSSRFVTELLSDYTWGRSDAWTDSDASLITRNFNRNESEVGAYAEYTYNIKEKLSVVAGIRYDYNFYFRRHLLTPRGHIKWNITPTTIIRASAGMGHRPTDIITDNIGILATGRRIIFEDGMGRDFNRMEKAVTAGGSLAQTISTIKYRDMTISIDYFRTQLFHSVIVDQERDAQNIYIYATNGKSFTNTYQFDLTWTPIERFDIFATFRWTDSRYTITRANGEQQTVARPLVGNFKTLINLQYATNMRKWVFDVTAQLNGSSWLPTQNGDLAARKKSPIYPMFFAQVSRRIKRWEIYLGCENIAGFTQAKWAKKHDRPDMMPIIDAEHPYATSFNSSCVWGPLMGRKVYIGVRFNLY